MRSVMRTVLLADRFVRLAIAAMMMTVAVTTAVSAQQTATYEVVANFENPARSGAEPAARLVQASDGTFYGTARSGGLFGRGTLFSITAAGEFTVLHHFTGRDGATPVATLIQARDGYLYGTTFRGGANDFGTVFRFDAAARTLTTLHSFAGGENGRYPRAGLVEATDGRFYGTTAGIAPFATSPANGGTIFRIDAAGTFSTLYRFSDLREPHVELIQARDGNLYGVTRGPLANSPATLFRSDVAGTVTTLRTFATGQFFPGPLHEAAEGYVYAVTSSANESVNQSGALNQIFFKLDTASGTFTDVIFTISPLTSLPLNNALVQASDGNFYGTLRTNCSSSTPSATPFYCETAIRMNASGVFELLHYLDVGEPGRSTGLVAAADGRFFGTTAPDTSSYAWGTVFRYDLSEGPTTLHVFGKESPNGGYPTTGVIQASDGRLYGTTPAGGASNRGTVFTLNAAGTVQALHSFERPAGHSEAGLTQGQDGRFYGLTTGETISGANTNGVIFRIDSGGSFGQFGPVSSQTRPAFPPEIPRGALLDGGDGFLYGTLYQTTSSSSFPLGAVFRLNSLSSFAAFPFNPDPRVPELSDGRHPSAGLFQADDRSLYGTTSQGTPGQGTHGTVFRAVFADCLPPQCNPSFTTLHVFTGPDGATPLAPVHPGSDGRLYGTTSAGGSFGGGTAFAIDTSGNLTTLHNFSGLDGLQPLAGLLPGSDANFYGTTCSGGAADEPNISSTFGTVFRISATGEFTTLHSFSATDGSCPTGELIQASDGHLYGTTRGGGEHGGGVLFRVRLATTAPSGYVEIVSRNSGKCLDIFGASTDAGASAIQWTCHGGLNQQWRLEPAGGGAFRVIARHSEQALDVFGASLEDIAPIIQWPVHGGDNQAWTLEPAGDGYVRIVARHSGKAMDVEGASLDEGARVIQYTPHGGANQQWLLRAVGSEP